MSTILVTGGLGFIGSHTVVELYQAQYNVVVIDNLSNSSKGQIEKIKKLVNSVNFTFIEGSINDKTLLEDIFSKYNISTVIHFAALKSVSESIQKPLLYYDNNVTGTINLLTTMSKANVKNLIFSSSATVYGNQLPPLYESAITGQNLTNPYGKSKFLVEEILKDLSGWNICILRYFNPIGAHESGLIGENPNGIPNNLMPYLLNVAKNYAFHINDPTYEYLKVYGNTYNTLDGTGVRDYIHVVDLARAHVKALTKLGLDEKKVSIYNLGTGKGTSVLELIHCFEEVNHITIPYKIFPNRPGDVAESYCNSSKAKAELSWEATKTIKDMCKDGWNFIVQNTQTLQ